MLKKLFAITTALYLTLAGPAHAMPTVIGGLGALMSTQIAAGVTLGSIALGIASMGAQWLLSKMLTPEPKQRGIKSRMETGGDNPPTFIVGEYATPGQLIYANERDGGTNIPNSLLVYVVQLSCMPIDGVSSEIFINNERCTIDTSETFPGGFYAVDEYVKGTGDGGYLSMKFHLGNQTSADNWLLDTFGSDPDRPWSNNMFLPGCAYAVIRMWYSNRGIWTGIPTFRFVVRGAPVYDPRRDSTVGGSGSQRWNNPSTWTFSRNPKVIEFNTHRGFWYDGDHVWGGKAEAYRLPLEYWFAAMNACDEDFEKKNGDIVKRYRIGAEISLDDSPIEFITEINKSCDGYTTEYGGTYKTWCGGPGLAVGTITDADWLITEDMETNRFQGREQTFNTCYATYPEPRQMWEVKEAPPYVNATALEEDGEELALDLPLPLVSENNQVQRLSRSAIKDSRRQVTHAGVLPPLAYLYEPFDLLMFQSAQFGYDGAGKRFMFASGDDLPNVNQQVMLREVDPNDHGYVPADEQDFEAAPLVNLRPGELTLDLDVFADQVDTASGKDRPAIRAEWVWGGADIDVQYVDWQLRRPGTTKVIARGRIVRVEDDQAVFTHAVLRFGKTYEVQFRPKPFSIRESAWTGWKTVTCVVVDVPTAPSLTRVSKLGNDGKLTYFVDVAWTLVAQEGSYAVRAVVDGQTTIHPALTSPLRIPAVAGSTNVVSVAAVGADGTVGDWSSSTSITVTKKNTAPTAPTVLTATGRLGRIDYVTNKNPDSDFDHFNLYASNTNDFTTAVLVDDSRSIRLQQGDLGNAVTRYAWITAVDSSGNESAKFPLSNTAGRSATTTRVASADLDDGAVTAPKLGNQAVTPIKLMRGGDSSNIVPDNDMFEGSGMWAQGSGGGTPIRVRNTTVGGTSEWAINQASTTTIKEVYSQSFPVKGGKTYAVATTLGPLTAVSATMTFIINWYSINDTTGALSYISGAQITWTGTTQDFRHFLAKAPAGARRSQIIARIAAGPDVGLWYSDPMVRRATESDLLADNAVTDDKIVPRDQSNMVRNPNMDIVGLWTGTGGTLVSTPSADVSESANTLSIAAATAATTISTLVDIPVKAGKVYYIGGELGTTNGEPAPTFLQVLWFSMNAAGVTTFINSYNTPILTGAGVSERETTVVAPANARRALLRAGKNASATAADLVFRGPMFRKAVEESQTDQTAPGTPAAPTLGTITADIDGDGTIDAGLSVSITAPAGVKVIGYEIERHNSNTLGGTYTARGERLYFPAEDPNTAGTVTTAQFKANQSKFWRVRARAVAYNGRKGVWSPLTTTGVSPLGYSATLTASAPAVTRVANGYRITWTKPADKAYKETEILANGVALTRVSGTAYVDTTSRTVGDTPTYTVRHYDKSDNVGSVSSGTVAAAYRAAVAAEVGVLTSTNLGAASVTTAALDTGAVTTPALGDLSVTPRKADLGDTSNTIKDNQITDLALYTFTTEANVSINTPSIAPNHTPQVGSSANKLVLEMTTSHMTADLDIFVATTAINACTAERRYVFEASVHAVPPGASSIYTALFVQWFNRDSSGVLTQIGSDVQLDSNGIGGIVSIRKLLGDAIAPAGAILYALKVRVSGPVVAVGSPTPVHIGGLSGRESQTGVFEINDIAGGFNIGAGNTATPLSITSNHTKAAQFVTIAWCFKNNSGVARAFTIEWWKTPLGGTATRMISRNLSLQDDNPFYMEYVDQDLTTDSTFYECRITNNAGSGFFTVAGRYAVAQAYFG